MEENRDSDDCTDNTPSSYEVTKTDLAASVISIILHCVDVGFDYYVAYKYFEDSKYSYGAWSLALILLPSIVLTSISVRMYVEDLYEKEMGFSSVLLRVILCILGLPIQSAPLIRTIDSLYFAVKSFNAEKQSDLSQGSRKEMKKKYLIKMIKETSDLYFLKVFETYLEAAPQQVLQLTLLILEASQGLYNYSAMQIFSICISFFSMSLSMAKYNECIRLDQEDKQNVTISGLIIHFIWHLLFPVSRILVISSVTSLYPIWTCVAIGIHWFILSIWPALLTKHNFCPSKFLNVLFAFTVGAVCIFNFFSLKDKKKKYDYLAYYVIIFVENTIAGVIWALKSSFKNWFYSFFAILPHVCFVLGVIFMILYYKCFHPTLTIRKTSVDNNIQKEMLKHDDNESS